MIKGVVAASIILIFFGLIFFSGCVDENQSPQASFSIYPTIAQKNSNFFLNSTSYDPDGTIENFTWFINYQIIGYGSNITYTLNDNGSYIIKLVITDDKGLTDFDEKFIMLGNSEAIKERFIGSWGWSGNNQTGLWIFHQNNSLKSTFTGIGGATNVVWWHFEINESKICFGEPSNPKLKSGCYTFEFKSNYSTLLVIDGGNSAEWQRSV